MSDIWCFCSVKQLVCIDYAASMKLDGNAAHATFVPCYTGRCLLQCLRIVLASSFVFAVELLGVVDCKASGCGGRFLFVFLLSDGFHLTSCSSVGYVGSVRRSRFPFVIWFDEHYICSSYARGCLAQSLRLLALDLCIWEKWYKGRYTSCGLAVRVCLSA